MPPAKQERNFLTRQLPDKADVIAPDGSEVRIMPSLQGSSAAHFRLEAGKTSRAGYHQTVEEVWYVVDGIGEIWRRNSKNEVFTSLTPGMCLTIPLATSFQFRALPESSVSIFAVTIPAWPTEKNDEWVEVRPHWPVSL